MCRFVVGTVRANCASFRPKSTRSSRPGLLAEGDPCSYGSKQLRTMRAAMEKKPFPWDLRVA